jgi:DNA (cytosine-5)-methyltransferase 1
MNHPYGLIADLFAGGGGASTGIRMALGRDPDIAVNHDAVAVAMHAANHPGTRHYQEDIWKVHPLTATKGQPVALLWASPDCKHFSRAKGAAPTRDKEVRALAWVVAKWARLVRPNVVLLENVQEFSDWGPLDKEGRIIAAQKGLTFQAFLGQLRHLGYAVEHRCLRACDYGAPTIRRRLFLIARCDGLPIVWPEPTHGDPKSEAVKSGLLPPWRTAAEIIDWSIPCPSIFERKKPLAENTLRRIAEGIRRYVVKAAEPFIVTYYGSKHPGDFRGSGIDEPLRTQTTENRFGLIIPHLQRQFSHSIGHGADEPIGTITAGGGGETALVTAFMAQHNGGSIGHEGNQPLSTIVHRGTQQQIVTSHLLKLRGTCRAGQAVTAPMPTVTSEGLHVGEVRAFLIKYYGTGGQHSSLDDPMHTLPTKDRMGLVTVHIAGEPYIIADIGMRILSPRELFRAQGFPDEYKIDIEVDEKPITKSDQVRMCGNSVCPQMAQALITANLNQALKRVRHG